mmetsp:Transcript_20267/g.29048  ORF Transcript_20267/g.29048 Transcript_20267/m.29048 type:complete len:425 (-) Transcript_20267:892-2166(-)
MVSVFEGQLTRTWLYPIERPSGVKRTHVINLYHDTITGVRSVMLDFQEVSGSLGNSSLIMESKGHRIFFTVEDLPGYIEIKKSGWTGFSYTCVINTIVINEITQTVATNQEEVFRTKILATTFTKDEFSEHSVAWYVLQVTKIHDGVTTAVHRRFRDFAELNSQVKQNMKGHHLRWSLPPLPEKPLKAMTDHNDPAFIQDRSAKLERFISMLVSVPHVSEMICVRAFLGLMDQVREFSVAFTVQQLGMSLVPSTKPGDTSTPAIVGQVHKPDVCIGVMPGDTISKINGVAVTGCNFNGVVNRIRNLPRPLIIHFIQVISSAGNKSPQKADGPPSPLASNASQAFDWEANENTSNDQNNNNNNDFNNNNNDRKNSDDYSDHDNINSSFMTEEIPDQNTSQPTISSNTESTTSSPVNKMPQPLGWD